MYSFVSIKKSVTIKVGVKIIVGENFCRYKKVFRAKISVLDKKILTER